MKKYILIISLSILGLSFNAKSMNIGFVAGLAIPSEDVAQFFENFKVELPNTSIGNYILQNAATLGYSVGMKGRMELSNHFQLVPSIMLCRFNQSEYDLVVPDNTGLKDTIGKINVISNVVPISVGVNAHILKSFIGLYGMAEFSYNYISYSHDLVIYDDIVGIPLKISPTYSRLGFGIGAGIDIDFSLLKLNFEFKFNSMNLIGRATAEPQKTYNTITLGIFF